VPVHFNSPALRSRPSNRSASFETGFHSVRDTQSFEEKKVVEVGPDAHNVRYDARANTVLVSYGNTNGGAIAIFEPRT
jgi:hypothetical protein